MTGGGKVCDSCGAPLRPTLRFCTECGQIVAPVTTYAELTRPIDDDTASAVTVALKPAPQTATAAPASPVVAPTRRERRGWRTAFGGIAVFLVMIALLVVAAGVGVAFRDTSEPLPFISATLARDVLGEITPIDASAGFDATDDAFYLTFAVIGAEPNDVLKSVWIAADVGDAAPRNTVIDEATITFDQRDESGSFRLQRGAKPWPAGAYQVKLYVNDRLAQTHDFTVGP